MDIFVINLDHATERLAKVKEQLDALELPFKRINAIDGQTLDLDNSRLEKKNFKLTQLRECTLGELGCAESHRKAWTKILKDKKPYSLILEDDVLLPENLPQVLSLIEASKSLDIINLSSTGTYPITSGKIDFLNSIKLKKRPYFKNKKEWKAIEAKSWKIFKLLKVGNLTLCECSMLPPLMSAYVVTPRACEALLEATAKISFPVDYAFRHTKGNIVQSFSFPAYIHQNKKINSTIGYRDNKINLSKREFILRFLFKKRSLKRRLSLLKMYGFKVLF